MEEQDANGLMEQTISPTWLTIVTSRGTVIFEAEHGINRHGSFWQWETINGSGYGDIKGLFFTACHTMQDYKRYTVTGQLLVEFNTWLVANKKSPL